MDVGSIFFSIVMGLMGGFIAVLADNLGRHLGKSRKSIFGLRPRKTGQVLTFAAGFVIPILTIVIVVLVSSEFRKWLFEGRQAISQVASLREEQQRLVEETSQLKQARETANRELEAAQRSLKNLNVDRDKLLVEKKKIDAQVKSLREQTTRSLAQIRTLSSELRELSGKVQAANVNYQSLRSSFRQLQVQNNDLNTYNRQLDRENQDLERQKNEFETRIKGINDELARLQKQRDDLEKKVVDARAEYDKELEELSGKLTSAQGLLAQANRDLNALNEEISMAQQVVTATRNQPLIYQAGEEVSRAQIEANLSSAQVRNLVLNLLRRARVVAEARGARSRGGYPAASIIDRQRPDGTTITSDEILDSVISQLSRLPEPTVIIAVSSLNAFRGEPVSLDVVSFRNPLIYAQDALVAELTVNGARSDQEVYSAVMNFLDRDVPAAARKAGMVPQLGVQNGLVPIEPIEMLRTISQIRAGNATVRLQVLAVKETRAGDPLQMRLRVR